MAKASLADQWLRKELHRTSSSDSRQKKTNVSLTNQVPFTEAVLVGAGDDDIKYRYPLKPDQVKRVSARSCELINISPKRARAMQELCEKFSTAQWRLRCVLSNDFFEITNIFCPNRDEDAADRADRFYRAVTFGIIFEQNAQSILNQETMLAVPLLSDTSLPSTIEESVPICPCGDSDIEASRFRVDTSPDLKVEQGRASFVSQKSRRKWQKSKTDSRISNITTSDMSVQTAFRILLQLTQAKEELDSFEGYFDLKGLKLVQVLGIGGFGAALAVKRDHTGEITVLKLIPLDDEKIIHVLREVLITDRLHELRLHDESASFPKYYGCAIISGQLDPAMLNMLNDSQIGEEFTDATVTKWLALELEYGGDSLQQYAKVPEGNQLLEHHGCAVSILFQVLLALATSEEMLDFEHRDCHWENILILKNANVSDLVLHFDGVTKCHDAFGLSVMIIDFGLSRCRTAHGVEYLDLNRYFPDVLQQSGTVQYVIYRRMHDVLDGFWNEFNPRTNALWIEYLIDKLLHRVAYENDSSSRHIIILETLLKNFNDLPPSSAKECLRRFFSLI